MRGALLAAILVFSGCATKVPDMERINYDTYAIKSAVTALSDSDATKQKLEAEAVKYCVQDGRKTLIKNIKSRPADASRFAEVEVEFRCVSITDREALPNASQAPRAK